MKSWAILLLAVPLLTASQTRNESWLKFTLTHQLKENWSAGIELQYRRQANYRSGEHNILQLPLGSVARLWFNHKLQKNWTLLFSPAGFFQNDDILNSKGEISRTNEVRVAAGATKSFALNHITNKNRLLLEERFISSNEPVSYFQTRLRLQNSFSLPLFTLKKEKTLSFFLSHELFLKAEKKYTGFDQSRIYNAIQCTRHNTETLVGYQWTYQKSTGRFFHRNQLYIQFNFTI